MLLIADVLLWNCVGGLFTFVLLALGSDAFWVGGWFVTCDDVFVVWYR